MKTRIKINGLIIIFAVILMAIFPGMFLRHRHIDFNDEFLRIAGFGFIFLGQLLRVSARGYKSERSQNSGVLVKGGPYAAVRNPMYLGILLIGIGVNLILFRWWVMVLFAAVFIARYFPLMMKEEKKLLAAFPGEYAGYMQETPRLFFPLKMARSDVSEYLPLKFTWLKKERGSIIATVSLVLLIELWRNIRTERPAAYFGELAAAAITAILFTYLAFYLNRKTYGLREEVTIKG